MAGQATLRRSVESAPRRELSKADMCVGMRVQKDVEEQRMALVDLQHEIDDVKW